MENSQVQLVPKFAIIYTVGNSIFSGGRGQVALVLYEFLQHLQIPTTFVNVPLSDTVESWWTDCYEPENIERVSVNDIINRELIFDYVIDIDGLVSNDIRQKIAKHTIVFYRKRFLINEIENAVYLQTPLPLNILGAHAVWMWEEFNKDELEMLNSVIPCSVFLLPYTWSSKPIEHYMKQISTNPTNPIVPTNPNKSQQYDFILIDKNFDNQSNSVVPITSIYNFIKNSTCEEFNKISKITVINGKILNDSEYFQTNIMKNTFDLIKTHHNIEFVGRQRLADFKDYSNNLIALSHIRFQPFQPFMLDLAWLNIPFIHNSPFIADLHSSFQSLYYPESSVEVSTEIIRNILKNGISVPDVNEIHNMINSKFSTRVNINKFKDIFQETITRSNYPESQFMSMLPSISENKNDKLLVSTKEYQVLFLDLWEGFDPNNNFFMDLFKANKFNVVCFEPKKEEDYPDFIIQGPFSKTNELYPDTIPRIYFSGECESRYPINHKDERIKLFLTFNLRENERYMRLPIWVLYLDWFNKSIQTNQGHVEQFLRNPGIMPLTFSTEANPISFNQRREFCSFVVSNPNCNIRNIFFKKLSATYKKVNSAGQFLNNIGGPIGSNYEGGGQGDATKHNYLTQHRFNICFENTQESGYITEKVLQAKLAGCVPLYWGEQNIAMDFDPRGIVNLTGKTLPEMIQTVKYLDEHPEEAAQIAKIPALSEELLWYWQNRLTRIASRIRTIVENSARQTKNLPEIVFPNAKKSLTFLTYLHENTEQSHINSFFFSIKFLEKIIPDNLTLEYSVYYHPDISQQYIDNIINYDISNTKQKLILNVHKLDTSSINPFPTFWKYETCGWRCELLKQVSTNPIFKNKTVVFQTYECIWTHIPEYLTEMLNTVENPILFLRNMSVKNSTIAPEIVRNFLQISSEELNAPVVEPDIIVFKAGSEWINNFLNLASAYIQNKNVLVECPNVSLINNEIVTHKHDNIVWSVLVKRYALPNIDIEEIIDLLSLRSAYKNGKSIYLHKGKFIDIHRIYPNIDCISLINLDRRKDRLNTFYENNPGLLGFVERVKAVDGKEIKLDRQLIKLFRANNFSWKKSVMGCALSHYNIWKQLVNENSPKINNYLVLEDDVRFINTYQADMINSLKNLPEDWDVLYLGGVLPVNRENYPNVLEKIKGNWYSIVPNPCFSGNGQNIPIFHHCTYSYIVNRKGATKLLEIIKEDGIFTSLDHLLMSLALNNGKIFVHYPSVTYSFQDEDEDYKKSEFDNFNRIVKYDSDIWNNTECFTEKDIHEVLFGNLAS